VRRVEISCRIRSSSSRDFNSNVTEVVFFDTAAADDADDDDVDVDVDVNDANPTKTTLSRNLA